MNSYQFNANKNCPPVNSYNQHTVPNVHNAGLKNDNVNAAEPKKGNYIGGFVLVYISIIMLFMLLYAFTQGIVEVYDTPQIFIPIGIIMLFLLVGINFIKKNKDYKKK